MPEVAVEVFARPGSRISDDAAQRVFGEAKRLPEDQRTAENLVNVAKDPQSPIHDLFEWDDATAAAEHRREQARRLMRSVRVRIIHEDSVEERPAFVSVRVAEDKSELMAYVRYSPASEEDTLRESILRRAKCDVRAFQARYARYEQIFSSELPELVELLRLADRILDGEDEAA